jgi:hypothetical protein
MPTPAMMGVTIVYFLQRMVAPSHARVASHFTVRVRVEDQAKYETEYVDDEKCLSPFAMICECEHMAYAVDCIEILEEYNIDQDYYSSQCSVNRAKLLLTALFLLFIMPVTTRSRPVVDPETAGYHAVPNPYTGAGFQRTSGDRAVDAIKRLIYMGISLFFLIHRFNIYQSTIQSPHVRHEWFKVGLAATIGK